MLTGDRDQPVRVRLVESRDHAAAQERLGQLAFLVGGHKDQMAGPPGRHGTGRRLRWVFPINQPCPANTWCFVGSDANNQTSSLFNNRGNCTLLAKNWPVGPNTPIVGITPFRKYGNLANNIWPNGTAANDTISAYMFLDTTTC